MPTLNNPLPGVKGNCPPTFVNVGGVCRPGGITIYNRPTTGAAGSGQTSTGGGTTNPAPASSAPQSAPAVSSPGWNILGLVILLGIAWVLLK